MSNTLRKALAIVAAAGDRGIMPNEFASDMWPDSPSWKVSYNVGHGAHRGAAMYRAAGGYLGRLRKSGYVRWRFDGATAFHVLTPQGSEYLEGAENGD